MTVTIKELMRERSLWEQIQTDYSHDEDLYKFCECKMQRLDEEAEKLRYLQEKECSNDR